MNTSWKNPLALLSLALCLIVPQPGQAFHNPSTGRWLSRDPVGEDGGKNLFLFNQNTPVTTIDPDGRCCCCCAEWISIEDRIDFPTFLNTREMGNSFNVKLGMYYPGRPGEKAKSCKFKWIETTDLPTGKGEPEGVPYDVIEEYKTSQQASAWAGRKQPCGGTETLEIPDKPVLQLYRGRNDTRHLSFVFQLESAPGCPCSNDKVTKRLTQVLVVRNGRAIWLESEFTISN
jgi:hypothetical protein